MEKKSSGEEEHTLRVSDLAVKVVRKNIKNVHLSVYPPDGQVRIAVPEHVDDDAARLAVIDRLDWIRSQQKEMAQQTRQSKREMVTGESHYVWGQRCLLNVIKEDAPGRIEHDGPRSLNLYCRPDDDVERRRAILSAWYRDQLKERIPGFIEAWEPKLGVEVKDWGVKKMKTKWGSCSAGAGRIWLNLELAKKPLPCLEYIIVHEMVHLLERHHNDRFWAILNKHMPKWKLHRDTLNEAPLSHEDWSY